MKSLFGTLGQQSIPDLVDSDLWQEKISEIGNPTPKIKWDQRLEIQDRYLGSVPLLSAP